MQNIAYLIFGMAIISVFYVYVGYPLLAYIVGYLFPKPVNCASTIPPVSIIITAYNEEKDIRKKLENTLLIDYPREKREIIVVSDASTDRTEEIAGEYESQGVVVIRQSKRAGKTSAQNLAVQRAAGEIILFSDATTMYERNVLRAMLPNFADITVGCVAGKLIYVDPSETNVGKGAKRYCSYETFIKESESTARSLIGVSGCLYAVRKSAYQPMYPEACSDFLIATLLYKQGLRTIYEPNAVCTEETNSQSEEEMRMRIRVISQTLGDLWRNREMLNPFQHGFFAVELISHKLLRYSVPVFLLLAAVSCVILAFHSTFFLVVLALQVMFYLMALVAWLLEIRGVKAGFLAIPFYFVVANVASVAGFYKFLTGERFASWEPSRSD